MLSSESTLEPGDKVGWQSPTCKFYSLNRWCRYGSSCRFAHERYSTSWNNSPKSSTRPRNTKYYRSRNATQSSFNPNCAYQDSNKDPNAEEERVEQTPSTDCAPSQETDIASNSDHTAVSTAQVSATKTVPHCRFYASKCWCPYGNHCRFIHVQKPKAYFVSRQTRSRNANEAASSSLPPSELRVTEVAPDQSKRICAYFKRGNCRKNDKCRYVHPTDADEVTADGVQNLKEELPCGTDAIEEQAEEPFVKEGAIKSFVVTPKKPCLKEELLLAELNEDEIMKLRAVEICQLKKRFTRNNLFDHDNDTYYTVTVSPTDPDWPYDVREVKMKLTFPPKYPHECLEVVIQSEDNEALPDTLSQHLSKSATNWLKIRHQTNCDAGKVELIFRPFLRWFDKSLEGLFTDGLRKVKKNVEAEAAGIEFVPYQHLPGSQNNDTCDNLGSSENDQKQTAHISEEQNHLVTSNNNSVPMEVITAPITNRVIGSSDDASLCETSLGTGLMSVNVDDFRQHKKGTEIKLRNLQFGENIATIVCQKLHITLQCSRCKSDHDIHTEPRRRNVFSCTKCHHSQQVTFRPSILHQYTTVLGYLDLEECQAFDLPLVDCIFAIECLNCNKQMSVDGIHYGKMWQSWCHYCNSKLSVYVDSMKFQLLQPNEKKEDGPTDLLKLEKKEKKVKDPSIQEGRPLPNNGTCKHYKKSYRWFRFPCCGKAYPCDVCHNEKELEHDMKYATRVICGFCAKEQPFSSNKPCVMCASNMTKVEKSHWEGGKGCRDKGKMSRDDKQKYTGLNKTVSRKVMEVNKKSK